jgi:dTDP-4-dehydrorhamnose 3,5-epimerase
MKKIGTLFPDVFILEPDVFSDSRGYFMESFNHRSLFDQVGIHYDFIQDNQSLSVEAGTVRGLHYQLSEKAQTKLVRVLSGVIYDVVVDIRKNSPSFGKWISVILSSDNKRQLLIPKGYAHGFCTLGSNVEILYKVDNYYSKEHDRGIIWNDRDLRIEWPISSPILSIKDQSLPSLANAEIDF